MPPEWMWPFEEELEIWFEEVEAARNEKYGNPGDTSSETPMMRNQLLEE